jgi:hypothetical protein
VTAAERALRKVRNIFLAGFVRTTSQSLSLIASTFKRHGYYCRSRKPANSVSRKKSCINCARAKIRCDWTIGRCSNCKTKDIVCQYTNEVTHNLPSTESDIFGDSNALHESLALSTNGGDAPSSCAESTDLFTLSSPDFSFDLDTNLALFSPKNNFPEAIFAETLDLQSQQSSLLSLSSFPSALEVSPTYDLEYPLRDLTRCMLRRRLAKPQHQVHATLIIQIIASFPAMMLRRETFPPFIHTHSFSAVSGKEHDIPEALINCMSIAQLFKTRTKENSRFLWKTIRMEHERLWSEVRQVIKPM